MAGTFDLREDIDEVGEAEGEAVVEGVIKDEGGVDVGVATTNSGL
jgi:copper homeostasis protein CutC